MMVTEDLATGDLLRNANRFASVAALLPPQVSQATKRATLQDSSIGDGYSKYVDFGANGQTHTPGATSSHGKRLAATAARTRF